MNILNSVVRWLVKTGLVRFDQNTQEAMAVQAFHEQLQLYEKNNATLIMEFRRLTELVRDNNELLVSLATTNEELLHMMSEGSELIVEAIMNDTDAASIEDKVKN